MKGLIFKLHLSSPITAQQSIDQALTRLGLSRINQLIIQDGVDNLEGEINKAADWLSNSVAGYEAIWALIHSGLFITASSTIQEWTPRLHYTINRGMSSEASQWEFNELTTACPQRLIRSRCSDANETLADPDLYLESLNLTNLHLEIVDALAEAVRCFRSEIYMAAIVMLGKASEGAWIEMGLVLADSVRADLSSEMDKFKRDLLEPKYSFVKKLRDIVSQYESKKHLFDDVRIESGISLDDLRTAMQWADLVRESRNVIHHRAQSATDHTYEKVVNLFLTAVPHFRTVYRLYEACRSRVEVNAENEARSV